MFDDLNVCDLFLNAIVNVISDPESYFFLTEKIGNEREMVRLKRRPVRLQFVLYEMYTDEL